MIHLKQYYPPQDVDSGLLQPKSTKKVDYCEEEFIPVKKSTSPTITLPQQRPPVRELADLDHLSYDELRSLGEKIDYPNLSGTQSRLQRSLSGYLENNRTTYEPRGIVYLKKPSLGSTIMENSYGIPMLNDGGSRKLDLKEPDVAETM